MHAAMSHTTLMQAAPSRAPAAGFVVANDADAQRCNLLTHHTKRTCSPALVITNHDATLFPIIRDSQVRHTCLRLLRGAEQVVQAALLMCFGAPGGGPAL